MNTCDTCVHWSKETASRRYPGKDIGTCSTPAMLSGYYAKDEEIQPDSFLVEDDEGWQMLTGPKFGCVHWKARTE